MKSEKDLFSISDPCPFCNIASAFPAPASEPTSSTSSSSSSTTSRSSDLASCIPSDADANPERTSPTSFIVLSSPNVLAFLDILPMTSGHLLVCSRGHVEKVQGLSGDEGSSVGFWLPILARVVSRVTGVTDYNIVQNNGARAAQVVPHVHFHIIPRPGTKPELKNKSWTMFGRGQRDDLDDDEGARLAGEMRAVLREEIEAMGGKPKL